MISGNISARTTNAYTVVISALVLTLVETEVMNNRRLWIAQSAFGDVGENGIVAKIEQNFVIESALKDRIKKTLVLSQQKASQCHVRIIIVKDWCVRKILGHVVVSRRASAINLFVLRVVPGHTATFIMKVNQCVAGIL